LRAENIHLACLGHTTELFSYEYKASEGFYTDLILRTAGWVFIVKRYLTEKKA
jgi:hypothetical protein